MYELTVTRHFSAAHCLRDYDGACARLHGHNYRVAVTVCAETLPLSGMLMDFKTLKAACDAVVDQLDHRYLNDLPAFAELNPTSENLARFLFEQVRQQLEPLPVRVVSASVWESEGSCATYRED
jgi:6-pyruvoyltetrahydropterin/6-carboxytetrahydropterin synthase